MDEAIIFLHQQALYILALGLLLMTAKSAVGFIFFGNTVDGIISFFRFYPLMNINMTDNTAHKLFKWMNNIANIIIYQCLLVFVIFYYIHPAI